MSYTDQGCIPLGWSGSGLGIQDLSGSWCIKGTDESTDPDPDHPKEMHLITSHFTSIQCLTWCWHTFASLTNQISFSLGPRKYLF